MATPVGSSVPSLGSATGAATHPGSSTLVSASSASKGSVVRTFDYQVWAVTRHPSEIVLDYDDREIELLFGSR